MSTHVNEVTQRQSDGGVAQARGRTAETAMRAPAAQALASSPSTMRRRCKRSVSPRG